MDVHTRFLRQCAPFDGLDERELELVSAAVQERQVPAGVRVLIEGGSPGSCLYVVRSGAFDLLRGDRILDVIGPGKAFGHPTLLTGGPPEFTVRCREDAVVLEVPKDEALGVLCTMRGAAYLAETFRDRLARTIDVVCATPSTRAVHVLSLVRRPPVYVEHDATIAEAARVMSEEIVRAALVVTSQGLGIVTEGDLRDKVLAAGRSPTAPVSQIMTMPVRTMRGDRLAIEAAVEMMRLGVNHMPVVDERGKVRGVISSGSLMQLDALSPFALRWSFSAAKDEDEVVDAAAHIADLFLSLLDANLDPSDICRVLTVQHDAASARLLQLAFARHGTPPTAYAWLALGSAARWELTMASDQDNALAYEGPEDPEVDEFFSRVAAEVNAGLTRCGYVPDVSGVLAGDPRWRKSLGRWMAIFQDCLEHPDSSNLVRAALAFDTRQVAGELDVVGPLAGLLATAPDHPGFLVRLARTITAIKTPLGFRQRLIGPVDVKKSAALPVENLGRFYAFSNRVVVSSTLDRLSAVRGMGAVTDSTMASLQEAFKIAQGVRLRHHAEQLRTGRALDNVVDSDALPPLAQQDLQAALRAILAAQRHLSNYAPLGI